MNCPLPIECIEIILDHLETVTRKRDLYLLLTVNKSFFAAAVRRLYADPIKTIESLRGKTPDYLRRAPRRLLALVLRCSPDNSPEAQSLRSSFHADVHALPSIPTMDYLSLIKTIQYNPDCFGPGSALDSRWSICRGKQPSWAGLHDAFAWAVCGHRLPEIRSLEISWRSLPLYSSRIEDMLSIRSLRILTLNIPYEDVDSWTTTEKEKVEFDLKTVSNFASKWSAAYAKLPQESRTPVDIQLILLTAEDEWWMWEPFASKLKTIYLQMPVSPNRDLDTFSTAEWARFVIAPESFDFSRVRSIIGFDMFDNFGYWHAWPDQGRALAKVLQACRSLQKLELECWPERDDFIFQWAVQERQGATAIVTTSSLNRGGTKLLGQPCGGLVPLSELKLELPEVFPSWQDAVFAFGTTLQRLTIDDYHQHNEVDLCVFHDMPVLRYLFLSFRLIRAVVAPFSGCPRLTEIYLESMVRMENNQDAFERWDLARVHVLSLKGLVCHQFNQATLKDMPMLETLIVSDVIDPDFLPIDDYDFTFKWDRPSWGPFPRLKTLELSDTITRSFCWSMLEQCPALGNLLLDAKNPYIIEEADPLAPVQQPDFAFERPSWPLALYLALRFLRLHGYSISDTVLFDQLPRVAPNVTSLSLHSSTRLSSAQLHELKSKFRLLKDLDYIPYQL
ncbi:hypothetical protein DFQ27_008036 [Actinomortierella ambigua]|uniref:F-box domain-containing protein n=1 Tax=Actinomortierella ambigua TaxID=1343610 RepID=A0A9P6PRF0_9FUNG|nr:hypothetical protein DFQ27_008036 [Actinomortierella ambigua]